MDYRITFKSKKENIGMIRGVIAVLLTNISPTITFIDECKTIISECITNSIVHGYLDNEDGEIELEISIDKEYVMFKVSDYGVGIDDVCKCMKPLYTTKKSDERSGLGFTIMEIFSDKVEVKSVVGDGCVVSIYKKYV